MRMRHAEVTVTWDDVVTVELDGRVIAPLTRPNTFYYTGQVACLFVEGRRVVVAGVVGEPGL